MRDVGTQSQGGPATVASIARVVSGSLGAVAALIGGVYFALWLGGVPVRWAAEGTLTMKTNMALAQVAAGAALVLLGGRTLAPRRRALVVIASAIVIAVGGLTLAEHLLHVDLGIDQLIASEPPGAPATTAPNRIGLPGSITLVLLGAGLLLRTGGWRGATLLGGAAFTVVLVPLVGFVYGIGAMYSVAHVTAISWAAAVACSFLSVGLALGSSSDDRPLPLFWRQDPGGVLLRRTIVPAVVIPIALGFLRLEGERRELYDTRVGTGLFAVALASVFVVLLWRSAIRLSSTARDREHALAETARAAELVDLGDPLIELDRDWRIVRVNANYEKMTRMSRSELLGRVMWEVFPEAAHPDRHYWREYRRCREERVPVEFEEYYAPLGIWTGITAYPTTNDGIAIFARDVTQAKRMAEALRASEEKFRSVVENMSEGLVIFDAEGNTLYQNPASLRIHGIEAPADGHFEHDELTSTWRGWDEHERPLPFDQWPISRVLRNEHFQDQVLHVERVETGLHFYGSYNGCPIRDAEGKLLLGFITIRDITQQVRARTEQDRAEAALRERNEKLRDADRRKDEFLSMLSHELRNPLAPIRSSVYVLHHAGAATEQAVRARGVIERQTEHLTRIVEDLLDVTRITRGKILLQRDRVDLREVVRRASEDARLAIEKQGVTLRVTLPETRVWADADATRITQILGNLLTNARKFTHAGDEIVLTLRNVDATAEISVGDTGAGIDPELLPNLFDAFVQGHRTLARSEGGLGLGLALVRGLVEMHGGSIEARSEGVGKGAEFVVRLPLLGPLLNEHSGHSAAPARASTSRHVLVVDDNADAAESLAEVLELFGHRVDIAFDGPSAIEKVRRIRPDIVLCDIGLPGMSGYEVAKVLRAEQDRRIRLVAISGYAQGADVQLAIEAGFDAHVAKPANPEDIERVLAG